MREAIVRWDRAIDLAVDRLSSSADHSLLWHVCGIVTAIARGDDVGFAARFMGAMGVESLLTNGVVKSAFRRVRPAQYEDLVFSYGLHRPITSSFPSGHATAAFCAARLLGGGAGWYTLAAAVASTRVYVRLHHASDVVAGAAFGLALGSALRRFVR
jgi:undecaprenyl-diphosphatase